MAKTKTNVATKLIDSLVDEVKDFSAEPSFHVIDGGGESDKSEFDLTFQTVDQRNPLAEGAPDAPELLADYEALPDSPQGLDLSAWAPAEESPYQVDALPEVEDPVAFVAPIEELAPELPSLQSHDHAAHVEEEKTIPIQASLSDKTQSIVTDFQEPSQVSFSRSATFEKTVPHREPQQYSEHTGAASPSWNIGGAENLRIAQQRIFELEKELERLRFEHDELVSAAHFMKERAELLEAQNHQVHREKQELEDQYKGEINILKGSLHHKDTEMTDYKMRIEELESRLKSDFKKIRVRERELENRLEISRLEKNALVRSKDETILDQKRKIDHLYTELENYKAKCAELTNKIDENQNQFARTVKALRLALTNLEVKKESA